MYQAVLLNPPDLEHLDDPVSTDKNTELNNVEDICEGSPSHGTASSINSLLTGPVP